jgi:hypothetical protein
MEIDERLGEIISEILEQKDFSMGALREAPLF